MKSLSAGEAVRQRDVRHADVPVLSLEPSEEAVMSFGRTLWEGRRCCCRSRAGHRCRRESAAIFAANCGISRLEAEI